MTKTNDHYKENTSLCRKTARIAGVGILAVLMILCFVACGSKTIENAEPEVFKGDESGAIKITQIKSNEDPRDYAVDYYKNKFAEGDLIHWIVNKKTETSTCILPTDDGTVYVYVHKYVDGEEESMEKIGQGETTDMFCFDSKTGEIKEIEADEKTEE